MSTLPSWSSSSMIERKTEYSYDIFLSFNGKDTRQSFSSHLFSALTRKGIKTFRDDKSLERGEDFAPELLTAMGKSWGSIIIISEGYAFSHWCLKELVEIMKLRKERGHKVYPIFYHVEPSDFRHQTDSIKEAFDKHEKRHGKETTQGWRDALKELSDINGWPLRDQDESDFIEDFVKDVSEKIDTKILGEQEVEQLKGTFETIQAMLKDAENKQYMKQGEAEKLWVDKLKHIAYDMEDVLDEWNTAILKSKIEKDQGQPHSTSSSLSEVQLSVRGKVASSLGVPDLDLPASESDLGLPYLDLPASESDISSTFFQCGGIALHRDTARRIKELNDKCQPIVKDFPSAFGPNNSHNDVKLERQKTISLMDESNVYGRDHDKDALLHLLLGGSNGKGITLLAIVGMGGLGKTTLAQLVYNDDEVKKHFHQRIWVCVSDPFDEVMIAKGILETLKGTPSGFNELESLLQEIRQIIEGKKFLLVLDDVWTEDQKKWGKLKLSLSVGSQKSKILVTTRKERVARIMGCPKPFSLGVLSNEDSWSLFSKIAFFGRSDQDCKSLESIGRMFTEKCAGLPLAIKTLASLLRFKDTKAQWRRILVSEMWKSEDEVFENLFAPLMLSYHDLPMSLKQCFRYCVIFPKDHEINRNELIKLWMAQGFLGETCEVNDLEIIGEDYFNNLAVRGFFQQFRESETDGSIIDCKMHDIWYDFAQFLTKTECVLAGRDGGVEVLKRVHSSPKNIRHLTFVCLSRDPHLDSFKKLRSLSLFNSLHYDNLGKTLLDASLQLINLRMLNLPYIDMEIPKGIGELIHLRYLSSEGNLKLSELPETLCDLCNLQTLNIRWCKNLRKLPDGMGKLINLRHLQNAHTCRLTFMPKGMERLTCLQTLEWFNVVEKGGEGTESESTSFRLVDLGKLIHLRGSLTIDGLGNVGEGSEAPNLTKTGLLELILDFGVGDLDEHQRRIINGGFDKDDQRMIEDEACVLQALQPPQDLQSLEIQRCEGPVFPFPNWMMSLTSLKSVVLADCLSWQSLPPMGKLPSLESLMIAFTWDVKKVGEEFLGVETTSSSFVNHNIAFPNLKTLEFRAMLGWEEWEYENQNENERVLRSSGGDASSSSSDIIIMPKLQTLSISSCPGLKMLPRHLLQKDAPLQELVIKWGCNNLLRRYNRETGEDWTSISHIPTVRFFKSEYNSDRETY